MIQLAGLDPQVRARAEYAMRLASWYGFRPTITSGLRSWADQQRLWNRYQAGMSEYPAAPPGFSAHQYGWAWDSVVPAQLQDLWDQLRQAVGFEVPAGDRIHAEVPGATRYLKGLM